MQWSLLREILFQPTAPFRESHALAVITRHLDQAKIPWIRDASGNILAPARSEAEVRAKIKQTAAEPFRVFIAHTDHPGFHGVEWIDSKTLKIEWLGGSPTKKLNGAKVWLATTQGKQGYGVMAAAKLEKSGHALESAHVKFKNPAFAKKHPDATQLFGGFAFRAPAWRTGKLIYTQAADDLVGAAAMLQALLTHRETQGKDPQNAVMLFTRAEEVGFVGMIKHLSLGWWDKPGRPVLAVSLETSRTLPGALIGSGPVVRLGDRSTVFDTGALQVFRELAQRVLPGKHQVRIMDGGACEATACTAFGIPSIGISTPLGNYHNQGLELGPDSRGKNAPSPEFVHLDDVGGLCQLVSGLLEEGLPWANPFASTRERLLSRVGKYESKLTWQGSQD